MVGLANNPNLEFVSPERMEAKGYVDYQSMAEGLQTSPEAIVPAIIYTQGKQSDAFPLSFLSAGQKGGFNAAETNGKGIDDIEFYHQVQGRKRRSSTVFSTAYVTGDKPGLGGQRIDVTMNDRIIIKQHLVVTPRGYQLRTMGEPLEVGGKYRYSFQLTDPNPNAYLPLTELVSGSVFAMEGGAPVSASLSFGNRHNHVHPGKVKNQLSVLRRSFDIAGNIGKAKMGQVCGMRIKADNGQFAQYYIDQYEWDFMFEFNQEIEEHLWFSQYNRRADGSIVLKDEDNGEPIPMTSGVRQQIPTWEGYIPGYLTYDKLQGIVNDVTSSGGFDSQLAQYGNQNIIVGYCGSGFLEDANKAMRKAGLDTNQIVGDKFVQTMSAKYGENMSNKLMLTGHFRGFELDNGTIVILKPLKILDFSSRVDNGLRSSVTGKPLLSHEAYFLDMSSYEGHKNIQMVYQNGRAMIRGIEQGMSQLRDYNDWANYKGNALRLSTAQDKTSVHFMATRGITMLRNNRCFGFYPTTD